MMPAGSVLAYVKDLQGAEAEAKDINSSSIGTSGILYTFGKGDHGKLGHGYCTHATCSEGNCTENKSLPSAVESLFEVTIQKVSSLSTHSVAVTTSGDLYSWVRSNRDK